MAENCSHIAQVNVRQKPQAAGCQDCMRTHDSWVHLRVCLTCGHVGCCDSSKNRHATRHFHETHHPVVRSGERGEDWGWCYVDQMMIENILAG